MAAVTFTGYLDVAKRRWPLSAHLIAGNGPYAIVSKCYHRWKVLLYTNPDRRAEKLRQWNDNFCGAPCCSGEHFTEELHVVTPQRVV